MRRVLFKHSPLARWRYLIWSLAWCLSVLMAPAAMAQDPRLEIEYTVKVADQRGRGFSTEDLIRVVKRITRKSYESFFTRYVSGTDVPPYETILGYAGYAVERVTQKVPFLGVNLDTMGRVTGVPPGFDARTARLQQEDFIVSVDGQTLEGQGQTIWYVRSPASSFVDSTDKPIFLIRSPRSCRFNEFGSIHGEFPLEPQCV
jgi:hypothetical protein